MMDKLTMFLYVNSFVYYIIMFVGPVIFRQECGDGMSMISHYIYAVYSVLTIILEVCSVIAIQKKLNNKSLLKFNKWHIVELLMGQIARFDTYLDMCFLNLLWQCD